jgi:hypothetical protein
MSVRSSAETFAGGKRRAIERTQVLFRTSGVCCQTATIGDCETTANSQLSCLPDTRLNCLLIGLRYKKNITALLQPARTRRTRVIGIRLI